VFAMGWFDRTKAVLGLGSAGGRREKGERPPLKEPPPASAGATLEDALEAREGGRMEEGRSILRAIDRGKGLRTVLRAAAALEAGDEDDFVGVAGAIAKGESAWRLALQTASALKSAQDLAVRERLVAFAASHGAPPWALAWADPTPRGRVDLLFADPQLARTIAAREWKVEGAEDDREAIERYAGFAHGRDSIGRFGALAVARVIGRAFDPSGLGAILP
jgi:hypothetical protein